AHVVAAQAYGADIHARERALSWEAREGGVRVETERGVYEAERLVISAGPWGGTLIPELASQAVPARQGLAWLQPTQPDLFQPDRFPVFNLQVEEGRYYGFPIFSVPGFKFGRYHHLEQATEADAVDRECHPQDEEILRAFADKYFPAGNGPTMALKTCMFTNS